MSGGFSPATSDHELDSQMRALGVPMDQRKRIIAAAKLGVPNPLKQLGLSLANAPEPVQPTSRSLSPGRSRSPFREGPPAVPALQPVTPGAALAPPGFGGAERLVRTPARPPPAKAKASDEGDQDLDGFLAGGRAATVAMAKAKAAERARQEQVAREKAERERRRQAQLEREREAESQRQQEEQQRIEEEKRREDRRQARREEKLRRREQKKRLQAQEEDGDEDFEDDSEEEEAERRRRGVLSKGFFSQAYKGNQEQKRIWSEPIKGQVSNNYRGFTDADLDRRFGPAGGSSTGNSGPKLMTEEEVLALLRKGKSK